MRVQVPLTRLALNRTKVEALLDDGHVCSAYQSGRCCSKAGDATTHHGNTASFAELSGSTQGIDEIDCADLLGINCDVPSETPEKVHTRVLGHRTIIEKLVWMKSFHERSSMSVHTTPATSAGAPPYARRAA